jgi:hypothetical protein
MSSNLTVLQEDLNRTRRLVSDMRGIIQASSAHHAVLGDIEMYGEKKHKKLETKVFSNRTPLSPRARYLRYSMSTTPYRIEC